MRKIIEQAVVTLDGQVSTPQDWLPTRWAGEFEQLSKDLLFSPRASQPPHRAAKRECSPVFDRDEVRSRMPAVDRASSDRANSLTPRSWRRPPPAGTGRPDPP